MIPAERRTTPGVASIKLRTGFKTPQAAWNKRKIVLLIAMGSTRSTGNPLVARDSGHRVVMVDDNSAIRESMRMLFKTVGVELVCYNSPLLFLQDLPHSDCILLDVRMPEMSGIELHRHITERYPNLADRVVFLTGDTLLPEIRDVMEKSGCLFLGKPFRQDDLQKVLSTLTERVQVVHRAA